MTNNNKKRTIETLIVQGYTEEEAKKIAEYYWAAFEIDDTETILKLEEYGT